MRRQPQRAFTLVELLVVIGIIASLIAILLPALSNVSRISKRTVCQSNLRQVYVALQIYAQSNQGWLFPVGPDGPDGRPTTYGTNVSPAERWPARTFKITGIPDPLPTDPATLLELFTPPVLLCPEDIEPAERHSYVLNHHLADNRIKFGSKRFGLLTNSEVVVAGEKRTLIEDYYMETGDWDRVVEEYRHGIRYGSNYLYFDGHVSTELPARAKTGLDPWLPAGLPAEPG